MISLVIKTFVTGGQWWDSMSSNLHSNTIQDTPVLLALSGIQTMLNEVYPVCILVVRKVHRN